MRVEEQYQITEALEASEEPLTFDEMQEVTGLRSQDLRSALKELLRSDRGVYVCDVEDSEKYYSLKDE